ncbi:MAG TPA: hypothetical protein VG649_15730 [Candidatus Angelobacter sp.]|jgi:tetratricopeptide (TPR) repeat protein|nr:hypothetical protein [Candidatus Angelobacter sp.]
MQPQAHEEVEKLLSASRTLRLADSACRAQDWKTAAGHLAKTCKEEQSSQLRGRLIWKRIECLYAGGDNRSARRVLQGMMKEFPPETTEQWCLAIRLYPKDANSQFVLNTAVEGLRRHPDSPELLLHLERLCQQTGRWQAACPVIEQIVAAANNDQQYCRAMRVKCSISIHLRDLSLAQATAHQIIENIGRIPQSHHYLRLYAATVLACTNSLQSEHAAYLLHRIRAKEIAARIHVVRGWTALRDGDWGQVGESLTAFEQAGTGLPIGNAWKKLVSKLYRCVSDWIVAARLGFPVLAYDDLRRRLRAQGSLSALLHAFALVNMSLAERKLSQGLSDAAARSLCESLGAWAAFLQNQSALQRFVEERCRRYGIISEVPPTENIVRELDAFLTATMERYAHPDRLKLLWDLERKTAARVASRGGLRLPDDNKMNAGPFLANSLDLHRAVRGLRDQRIRLLFSPLGAAVALLERHQFALASKELERIAESEAQQGPRREDFQQLLVESYLEASQSLVAQVPVDINLVREGWEWAIKAAQAIGTEAQVHESIVEIATGRALVLFARKNLEEQRADPDKRSLPVRRQEAIELETLAWVLTKDAKIRNVLVDHLHRYAWVLFQRKDWDSSIEKLFTALSLKSNAPDVATDLAVFLRARRRYQLEQNQCDEAGAPLMEAMKRLREIDPNSEVKEIQEALAQLEDLGPVPFVEYSLGAMEAGNWKLATDLMVWALQVCSKGHFVRDGARTLYREMSLSIEHGSLELEIHLACLNEFIPKDLFEVDGEA